MGHILYMTIMFTFVCIFLLGLYGASVGSVDLFTTANQISGPWPTVNNGKCQFSTEGLSGSCNVLDAAELGAVFLVVIIGSVLYRVGAFFYLNYQIFTILSGFRSFPYLGWLFGFLMLIITVEGWKLFRSGHTS